jgi:hypothetical protein
MAPLRLHARLLLAASFVISAMAVPLAHADTQTNAQQLVKDVVYNELKATKEDNTHWMYFSNETAADSRQAREVVETKDGVIYRVMGIEGRPLSPEERKQEDQRIQKLMKNPSEQRKQQKARDEDAKKAKEMLEMLPNAFIWKIQGENENTIRLSFTPNPSFDPPTRETKVFHNMEGTMVVDKRQKRLKLLSGRLRNDVDFGGGFFGRLKKGGTFLVEQTDVGGGHWEPVLTDVHINGRALFFKTIKEQQHEICSKFHRVPDSLSLSQAAEMLIKNPNGTEISSSEAPAPSGSR